MSKVVFFDIDGTLLDDNKELPASAKEAIHEIQKQGIHTAIATGRPPFMITHLLDELNMDSFICFNGQYVVFEEELIYANPIPFALLDKISGKAKENGHALAFMNEETVKVSEEGNERVAESLGTLHMPYPETDPAFYDKYDIYQALLFAKEGETDYLNLFEGIHSIRWHDVSTDIIPAGGSKAKGIEQLIKRLGFEMENVYAFGDGLNDIEMLREAGTGIAMGNAHPAVVDHADFVTASVNEDGIANGLKRAGLLDPSFQTISK